MLEVKSPSKGRLKRVFAGRFHNKSPKVQAWSQVEGVGHYQ